jgi:hypothetical protein
VHSEAIALVHSYTDPRWIHDLDSCASAICFTRGSIHFESPNSEGDPPIHGSAFFYLNPGPAKFIEEFGAIGLVALPVVAAHVQRTTGDSALSRESRLSL